MRPSKKFFTSDWHIGHENVIRFSNRPFTSLEHMHKVLISNYNSTVKPLDTCFFLGDIGLCKGDIIKLVIKRLHGRKILILGNHDKKSEDFWYECGFDCVIRSATIHSGKSVISMSHFPLFGVYREDTTDMRGISEGDNWHGEQKNKANAVIDNGQFHLHGHIHSPNGGKSKKILGKQYDVGVDSNNYKPVSISTIESWISKYNQQIG